MPVADASDEDQVGKKLKCPDCGTLNLVPPAEAPAKIVSVLTSDGDDLQIDAALDPGERPPVPIPVRRPLLYEEEREIESVRQAELAARGITSGPQRDVRGRPIMPSWPLVTGVRRMLVTQEVIARWVLLSIVLGIAGQFLVESLLTPIQGQAEAIKLIFTVFGIILAAAWLAIAGPFFVAIIGDSAEGEDRILQPPQLTAFDWFPELFSFVMAISVAGLCGRAAWYLVQLVSLEPVAAVAIVGAVVVVILPITLLSTLLEASPLAVISPRLLSSLGRCAGPWLLFYSQAMALAAVVGAAAWALVIAMRPGVQEVPTLLWILSPLVVAALIVQMRLLGRLAWWISERMPPPDEPT